MKHFNLFIPITKVDEVKREVYGVATAEKVDKSGEIMDYETTKPYYKEWSGEIEKASGGKSLGNVREMHSSIAAGKVTQLSFNDDLKQIEICAKIIDDSSWNKVMEGVLTGFSHGGEYIKTWKDPENNKLTRYTAKPAEISVVDNPCLGAATFEIIRANGAKELMKFKTIKETNVKKDDEHKKPKTEPLQKWVATDGKTFDKKAECEAYELGLENKLPADNSVSNMLKDLNKALDDKEGIIDPAKDLLGKKTKPEWKAEALKLISNLKKNSNETYDVKTAIEALCLIEHLVSGEEWEELLGEGEESQVANLKEAVSRLKAFIAAEIMENEPEVEPMEMSVAITVVKSVLVDNEERQILIKALEDKTQEKPVEKAGARHSVVDRGHLGKAMGHLEDAVDHHEDATKLHEKLGKAHTVMTETIDKMVGCVKIIPWGDFSKHLSDESNSDLLSFKKAAEEGYKEISSHVNDMENQLDKAVKQHMKMSKSHDGIATSHDGIHHALTQVGAEKGEEKDDEHEKLTAIEMKKVRDTQIDLQKKNDELTSANTDLQKALDEVKAAVPTLIERIKKLEAQPMPAKGALYDASGRGVDGVLPVQKGHETQTVPAAPAETSKIVTGLSPEAQRRQLGIR